MAATLKVVDPGRGLEESDVTERRARLGPNRLREAARRRPWADRTDMMFMNTLVTRAADLRGATGMFALELLRHRRVAVAPGTAFGPAGEGWVRVSLAAETDVLLEGARRMAGFSLS